MANKQRSNRASKKLIKIEGIRISRERPSARVSFKELGKPGVYRVKARGCPTMFVKEMEDGKAQARIRGENPVAARDAAHAFQKGVKTFWA